MFNTKPDMCPKCESNDLAFSGYQGWFGFWEHLLYFCRNCHYFIKVKTADKRKKT